MLHVMGVFMHHVKSITNLNSRLYAKFDFIQATINHMEQKIFSSDESRLKCNIDSKFYNWWLRSADKDSYRYLSYIHFTTHISYIFPDYFYGIAPVCII